MFLDMIKTCVIESCNIKSAIKEIHFYLKIKFKFRNILYLKVILVKCDVAHN